MDEKLLIYPEVELNYMEMCRDGRRRYETLPEIVNGDYGYILRPGQLIKELRYRDTNYGCKFHVYVREIMEAGIVVQRRMGDKPEFVPWIDELPNGGVYDLRKLYIVPCDELYEKNSVEDILSGNIRLEECQVINGKEVPDKHGRGIWFQHGGWRTNVSRYSDNLKNFVKVEQQVSLTELQEEE